MLFMFSENFAHVINEWPLEVSAITLLSITVDNNLKFDNPSVTPAWNKKGLYNSLDKNKSIFTCQWDVS